MKTKQWLNFSSLCLILTLTVACGGKNSSGGGGSSVHFNPLQTVSNTDSGVLPQRFINTYQGEQIVAIFNQVLTWRNQSTESGEVLAMGFTRGKVAGTSSNTNCTSKTFLKFFDYQYCKNTSSSLSTVIFSSTPTQYCTTRDGNNKLSFGSVVADQVPYNFYGCHLPKTEYSKDKNDELNRVLSLNNGQWHLYGAQRTGNTIYLLVGERNVGPSFLYGIDMHYHSVYNPVSIQNVSTGEVTKTLILQ